MCLNDPEMSIVSIVSIVSIEFCGHGVITRGPLPTLHGSTGSGFGPDAYQYLQDCLGWEGSARLRPAWRWATVLTFFRGRRHEVVGAESVHAKDISGVRWLGQ